MNNNVEMNFDPMTGEPINNNQNNNISQQNIPVILPETNQTINEPIPQEEVQNINVQPIQSIPTIEQSKEQFINNIQNISENKKEEKKEGVNYIFIIVLFVIIFAAIFFLFPYLLQVL